MSSVVLMMFPGSLRIGTALGVPVRLHVTVPLVFLLLIVQFGYLGLPAGLLLYGSVLLHELGHAHVARRYGIPTAAIDLHLLGGMALMTEPAKNPDQEARVAAAGPLVSAVLGLVFLGLAAATGAKLQMIAPRAVDLFAYGAAVNLGMAVFNLLPALPMDGGRIFRALLSTRLGHLEATRIAAWVSRGFAALFVLGGLLLGAWSLALIGVMLFFLAGREQRAAQVRTPRIEVLTGSGQPQDFFDVRSRFDPRLGPRFGGEARQPFGPSTEFVPLTGLESREEFVDGLGRRYVIVTRIVRP